MIFLFLIASGGVAYKVLETSLIKGDEWREKGNSLYRQYMPIEAERGSILAEDLRPFAVSQPFFEIRMDLTTSSKKDFEKNVDSLAYHVVRLLYPGESPSAYAALLRKKRVEKNKYFLIKKEVSYSQLEALKKFPLWRLGKYSGGLIVVKHTNRIRPYNQLARRTIGLDRKNSMMVGLEDAFDKELSGITGKRLMQKVSGDTWIPVSDLSEIAPQRGNDVVTTLDVDLQDIVHHALLGAIQKHNAEFGTVVLMEVQTGAIKAISNISKMSEGGYGESYNYAIGWKSEPGSTFKLASVLALFEDEVADLDTWVDLNKGQKTFYGETMRDAVRHGIEDTDLQKAFEISSNVGVASLVNQYYNNRAHADKYIGRLKQFGLDAKVGIEIKGEPEPFIKEAYDYSNHWSKTSLAWMSHGYELQITPLQMLAFYNAVANNGRKMKPYLVSKIMNGEQDVRVIKPKVLIESIAKPSSISKAKTLLEGVVERGSGNRVKSELVPIAAKTGTAKLDYFKNGVKPKYLSSVAGYFPANNPQYSCIVFIGKPSQEGYYGGVVAGPVFKEIAESTYLSKIALAKAVNEGPIPSLEGNQLPAYDAGFKDDFEYLLSDLEVSFKDLTAEDWVVLMPRQKEVHLENRKIEKDKVPNVLGMGAKDAVYVLERCGLKVVLRGHGKVVEQSIQGGEVLSGKNKIYIRLG